MHSDETLHDFQLTDAFVSAGLMRSHRVEVHPKVAGQPLGAVLQTVIPRLQDKQLKTDKIQNAENAIADMVSKGEAFAGVCSSLFACAMFLGSTQHSNTQQTYWDLPVVPSLTSLVRIHTAFEGFPGFWCIGTEACISMGLDWVIYSSPLHYIVYVAQCK